MKKLTTKEFIAKADKIHKSKYLYKKTVYEHSKNKVCITCKIHGEFWQRASRHLEGHGCIKCRNLSLSKIKKMSFNTFKDRARKLHNNEYDYITFYSEKDPQKKITANCKKHGIFRQNHLAHLRGQKCPRCFSESLSKTLSNDEKGFLEKAERKHEKIYKYPNLSDVRNRRKIQIICPVHGIFLQRVANHLNGCGCPTCKCSKGELKIYRYFKKNNIRFIPQKSFKDLKDRYLLRFDFFLPSYNRCIEFDGIQHFLNVFNQKSFECTQRHDKMKNAYCKKKKIKLTRISYKQIDGIGKILDTLTFMGNK